MTGYSPVPYVHQPCFRVPSKLGAFALEERGGGGSGEGGRSGERFEGKRLPSGVNSQHTISVLPLIRMIERPRAVG